MADRVDAAVKTDERARAEAVFDLVVADAARSELRAGDDAVLAAREPRDDRFNAHNVTRRGVETAGCDVVGATRPERHNRRAKPVHV